MVLEYMHAEMIQQIRGQLGTEAQVEAYSREFNKAKNSAGDPLSCPIFYLKKGELNRLKANRDDKNGVSTVRCESCHQEFEFTSI